MCGTLRPKICSYMYVALSFLCFQFRFYIFFSLFTVANSNRNRKLFRYAILKRKKKWERKRKWNLVYLCFGIKAARKQNTTEKNMSKTSDGERKKYVGTEETSVNFFEVVCVFTRSSPAEVNLNHFVRVRWPENENFHRHFTFIPFWSASAGVDHGFFGSSTEIECAHCKRMAYVLPLLRHRQYFRVQCAWSMNNFSRSFVIFFQHALPYGVKYTFGSQRTKLLLHWKILQKCHSNKWLTSTFLKFLKCTFLWVYYFFLDFVSHCIQALSIPKIFFLTTDLECVWENLPFSFSQAIDHGVRAATSSEKYKIEYARIERANSILLKSTKKIGKRRVKESERERAWTEGKNNQTSGKNYYKHFARSVEAANEMRKITFSLWCYVYLSLKKGEATRESNRTVCYDRNDC